MNNYLNCKKIDTAIHRAKTMLINKAKKNGIYENFGSNECRAIEDKFIDVCDYSEAMNLNRIKLANFRNWAMDYTGR